MHFSVQEDGLSKMGMEDVVTYEGSPEELGFALGYLVEHLACIA